jgi:hypothetical protein
MATSDQDLGAPVVRSRYTICDGAESAWLKKRPHMALMRRNIGRRLATTRYTSLQAAATALQFTMAVFAA